MRRRDDGDFQQEIESHIEIEADRLIAEGVDPEEARQMARRKFGNVAAAQERFYESRRVRWLDELRADVRYALRALQRSPGFAAVAILTLTLGIGANTAIFSVVNAVLLRPLPYRDPASLVLIEPGQVGLTPDWVIPAWRDQARTLESLVGFNGPRPTTLIYRDQPEVVQITATTWDFLSFLGVHPALGRDFTEADAARGAPAVAILSNDLWRRHFGADANVIGRTVTIDRTSFSIAGVLPPEFRFPTAGALPAFGLPPDLQPDILRVWSGDNSLNVIGRLRPEVTGASASQELLAIYRRASADEFSPALLERTRISVSPLQERLVGSLPQRLWLVMGAVAFVLLVACANVANLLLARASTRHRELAVRSALGARKGRLARLLLTESGIIALLGSAFALLLALLGSGIARTLLANRVPHVADIRIDWAVMAFNTGLAVVVGTLCGFAALPRGGRINPATVLNEGGTPAITGRGGMRRVLLALQVSVTFVLTVGAGLFGQTLWNLTTRDNGFDARRLLTVRVIPGAPPDIDRTARFGPGGRFRELPQYWVTFFSDVRDRLQRLPGVASVGAISLAPLEGVTTGLGNIVVNGRAMPGPSGELSTYVGFVTPGYLQTMRLPLVAGRDFTAADGLGAPLVAIVNEAFQRRFGAGADILGARITSGSGPEAFTVVGIARDVPDRSLREDPQPLLVAPLAQMPGIHISWGALTFVVRTNGDDPMRLAPDVRRTIWSINPNIVINDLVPMQARLAAGVRTERDSALLFGLFAFAALVMAAIGVYGVAAYGIATRTREIGIRVALGAARQDVRSLVLTQTIWPTIIGVSIGVAAAAMLTRFIMAMVYGVEPLDPATYAAAVVVLISVALAATWAPVRRAMHIDPLVALRYE